MLVKFKQKVVKIMMSTLILLLSYILVYSIFKPYEYNWHKLNSIIILVGMIVFIMLMLLINKIVSNLPEKK